MKKAIIFHGTGGNSQANWLPWLKKELEQEKYQVWVPDLPDADEPDLEKYLPLIQKECPYEIDASTILIGHSSGAVTIFGLLESLPKNTKVSACYLVGAFKDDLGWDSLKKIFLRPFDFEIIKTKAKQFVFIHSDNDPYCPLEGARYLRKKIGGELIIHPNQFHFSIGTAGEKYTQFPLLSTLIKKSGYQSIVYEFIQHQQLLSLATYGDSPWIANVFYASDEKLNFYFISSPQRQHSKDIEKNSAVAISIIDSNQTPIKSKSFSKIGVQISGKAKLVTNKEEIDKGLSLWKNALEIRSNTYFSSEKMLQGDIAERVYKFTPQKVRMFHEDLFDEDDIPLLEL